ncbi:MAG: DUF799 family lipoprotein [Candidatus Scalindua sp.]|jgi:hypothetical protein|nr:DUF799 family lipoprotein [Candidatus Scalindua sp.]MDV5166280.1 DUF799 family lipoprotein [Candidatus Scalindua sp.]
MKKYAILFLLLSSCASVNMFSKVDVNKDFPHDEIQKVAVIMFEAPVDENKDSMPSKLSAKTTIDANAGAILSSITARELEKWGKYIVVNRIAVKEEMKLKKLKKDDLLHKQNFLNLGKQLGADAIVVGKIESFGVSYRAMSSGMFISPIVTKVSFTVRCVDVTTNETIWTAKIKGSSTTDNERALASKLIIESFEKLRTKLN